MRQAIRHLARVAALALLIAVSLLNLSAAEQSQTQSQPSESKHQQEARNWSSCLVRPDSPVLDFGKIPTNEPARIKLRVTNHDSKTRTLLRPQATGAIAVTSNLRPRTEILPGESVEVEFQMQASSRPGIVRNKSFRLHCEDQPEIVLPVRAEAISFVEAGPAIIDLEGAANPEICLRSIDGRAFKVTQVIPDCMDFVTRKSQREHVLALNAEALRSAGLARIVIVKTDHPQCRAVILLVKRAEFRNVQ